MKKMLIFLSFVFCSCSSLLFAQNIDWDVAKNHPIQLLNKVVDEANEEHSIQDTQLDGTTSAGGGYSGNPQYRLTNTLEYLKNNIHPYIQRIVFIGLALATILLIYNGFMMVTNLVNNGEGELSKVKNNFIYIGIGVVILTGFYYLIDIVVAVINLLFG